MKLQFIKNYRVLEVLECTDIELEQLKLTLLAKWVEFKRGRSGKTTKEFKEKSYLYNYRYIPGGFWHKLLSLKKRGYEVEITNLNEFIYQDISNNEFTDWCSNLDILYQPYDYQAKGCFYGLKYRISRGQFATGGGKTLIMYLMSRFLLEKRLEDHEKVLIIVPSVMLVNQTRDDFKKYHKDPEYKVDTIYGGSKRTKDARIIVGNIDSVANYDGEFFEPIGALFYDEAHKLKSPTYQKINEFTMLNDLKLIYSASGTFYEEKDSNDFPAMAISGPILVDVGAAELMEYGSISPVKIKQIKIKWNSEINKQYYEDPEILDGANLYNAETNFIKSLPNRVIKLGQIISKIEFNQLLLFKDRKHCHIYHKYLEQKLPNHNVLTIHGDIKGDERERIKIFTETNMNVIICATYGTMSTGVSINNLSTLHFIEGSKSFIMVRQSIGRALRLHPEKDYALIMDYFDYFTQPESIDEGPKSGNGISVRHARARKKIYKEQKFPFKYIEIDL